MAFQEVGQTGQNSPIFTGTLTPTAINQLAMAALSQGALFGSSSAGWNNLGIGQPVYIQQPANVLPVNFSAPIVSFSDLSNTNWADLLCIFQTIGTSALVGGAAGIDQPMPSSQSYNIGAVTSGWSVFVYLGNISELSLGFPGIDPLPTITDSSGNSYVQSKAIISTDTIYTCYLFSAINVASAADLIVTVNCAASRGDALGGIFMLSNLISPVPPSTVGFCQGFLELW